MLFKLAYLLLLFGSLCSAVDPDAVYSGNCTFDKKNNDTIKLRIGNGGAGQSGLIEALANAYLEEKVTECAKGFQIAWIRSDTHYSIQYLKTGDVDVAITYNPAAEKHAIDNKIAKPPSYYVFRDHFLLVGPKSNPANISSKDDISTIFNDLYDAAEGAPTVPPVRFLSRYDKSATNVKETLLWAGIGQVPWATAYSTWYHQYIAFPIQALTAAIVLEEYTLTDRGTILSLSGNLPNETVIYKAGTDEADDPLLNPAHLLIGENAVNKKEAEDFAKWLIGENGQKVVTGFKKSGEQLYSGAPGRE